MGAQLFARRITMGQQIAAGGAEKSQQCHKYFLQYSKFASERTQFRSWGRQTCFLPRTPSNHIIPLFLMRRHGVQTVLYELEM